MCSYTVRPERRAVRLRGVDRVRRAVGDVAADDDQRWPLVLVRLLDRRAQRVHVLGVLDALHVPPVRPEPRLLVLRRVGERGRAVDRDVVVVVDVDEPAEAEVPGQRGGLVADALRQVAVGADGEDAVVADVGAEAGPQVRFGDGHADAVGEALTEWPGGDLDAGGVTVLRMAGGPGAPLPELLDVVERQAVAAQVEHGVQQHRGMAGGEDEPVPVGPPRVGGVVAHDPGEEHVGERSQRHGGSRMAGVGLLDGVHRQPPDHVDRLALELVGHARLPLHQRLLPTCPPD
jgi:hypothetical protein